MKITNKTNEYREKMRLGCISEFGETDPEFVEIFENFAFDEVVNQDDLDDKTRFMAIIATLIGCQGIDIYKDILPVALNFEVTPIEVKEIVYQAVAYLGMARVFPFLKLQMKYLNVEELNCHLKVNQLLIQKIDVNLEQKYR